MSKYPTLLEVAADRRLNMLRRYDAVANECPECGGKRWYWEIHAGKDMTRQNSKLAHADNCALKKELSNE